MNWKKLILVRSEILGRFVNKFTSDNKYSRHNKENFLCQIQMQLSETPKTFSQFFIPFLKSTPNSDSFEKKGESPSLSISEIIDSEKGSFLNV